jgi:hypothetical protein
VMEEVKMNRLLLKGVTLIGYRCVQTVSQTPFVQHSP